jgi:hypothetical protein
MFIMMLMYFFLGALPCIYYFIIFIFIIIFLFVFFFIIYFF